MEDEADRTRENGAKTTTAATMVLAEQAVSAIDFNPVIALRYWIRSAENVIRQARIYDAEGHQCNAYILYLRYIELILNVLPRHPETRKKSMALQLSLLKPTVAQAIERGERLKDEINASVSFASVQRAVAPAADATESTPSSSADAMENAAFTSHDVSLVDRSNKLEVLKSRLKHEDTTVPKVDTAVIEYPSLTTPSAPVLPTNFTPTARLENGSYLRTLFVPASLRSTFLQLAEPNTTKNLETCGILCGTLRQNALFVSTLVVPAQEASSDSCQTTDEQALFAFQDARELLTFGWIHTHPTQTCFMSSVDLHTHASYQTMLSEAVAIVLAPKCQTWGAFRMTDPPGIRTILQCRQPGMFHPHQEPNLYCSAVWRSGHMREVDGLKFDVVDLRGKE